MRKLIFFCMLIPLWGISQTKNVSSYFRAFPKVDKVLEFEKALAAHAQKYHTGDWKWRVFEIQSGPDAGGYHVGEAPNSWQGIDSRGNLGTAHNNDWNKTVTIYMSERGTAGYSVFRDTLSTAALTDYTDKINITHWFPAMGWSGKIEDIIRKSRKAWEAGGSSVAVYSSSSSGPTQFAIVTRYKQGLKERETGFRSPFDQRYEAANGQGSFEEYLDVLRKYLKESWSELLFYRADLSSK